jgi:hypothetical protein
MDEIGEIYYQRLQISVRYYGLLNYQAVNRKEAKEKFDAV